MAKKKREEAHGGHGWFVTFADLMALMMSFFVMLVSFSTQDTQKLKIVAGSMRDAFGVQSPVATFAQTIYLDVALPAGGALALPALAEELAVYPVDGDVLVDGETLAANTLGVLPAHEGALLQAGDKAVRLAIVGGAPLDGHRFMWWNFVSSRKERIVQAAADWEAGRFAPVPGETEFIPLPANRLV